MLFFRQHLEGINSREPGRHQARLRADVKNLVKGPLKVLQCYHGFMWVVDPKFIHHFQPLVVPALLILGSPLKISPVSRTRRWKRMLSATVQLSASRKRRTNKEKMCQEHVKWCKNWRFDKYLETIGNIGNSRINWKPVVDRIHISAFGFMFRAKNSTWQAQQWLVSLAILGEMKDRLVEANVFLGEIKLCSPDVLVVSVFLCWSNWRLCDCCDDIKTKDSAYKRSMEQEHVPMFKAISFQ